MNLKTLKETAPWNWPEGTDQHLLSVLSNASETEADRLLAAELASDLGVINTALIESLLAILSSPKESEAIRGQAAISLGPVLELCDMDGFEDPTEVPIDETTFAHIQTQLHAMFSDPSVPKEVKRRILEASARAAEDWHEEAIHQAFLSGDPNWQLTSVFCMGYVGGFDAEILKALTSSIPAIQYLAISAAGVWQVDAAWPHVLNALLAENTDKPVLLAAIDAVASLRPREAQEVLTDLLDSDDEDVVEAASEAIAMAEERLKGHTEDDDEEAVSGDGTLN
jgi:uncharacterized protein (UPF0147 family)